VSRSFVQWRSHAIRRLGMSEREADEYARFQLEHERRRQAEKTDNGQLRLEPPPAFDPGSQITADTPWPEEDF
jgi:hypothetical protein